MSRAALARAFPVPAAPGAIPAGRGTALPGIAGAGMAGAIAAAVRVTRRRGPATPRGAVPPAAARSRRRAA